MIGDVGGTVDDDIAQEMNRISTRGYLNFMYDVYKMTLPGMHDHGEMLGLDVSQCWGRDGKPRAFNCIQHFYYMFFQDDYFSYKVFLFNFDWRYRCGHEFIYVERRRGDAAAPVGTFRSIIVHLADHPAVGKKVHDAIKATGSAYRCIEESLFYQAVEIRDANDQLLSIDDSIVSHFPVGSEIIISLARIPPLSRDAVAPAPPSAAAVASGRAAPAASTPLGQTAGAGSDGDPTDPEDPEDEWMTVFAHRPDTHVYATPEGRGMWNAIYKGTFFMTYGGGPEGGIVRVISVMEGGNENAEYLEIERSWGESFTATRVYARGQATLHTRREGGELQVKLEIFSNPEPLPEDDVEWRSHNNIYNPIPTFSQNPVPQDSR
jgi:hypothetical protein